ncbi:MAG: DUF6644 family protein [Pseudomonadota bacterium]
MSASIKDWLPSLAQAVETLAQHPAIVSLNQSLWLFSFIETLHLLSMAALGGAVLVLNLRLLGAVLPASSPQQVERATRPFLIGGIVGTVATGLIMTLATTVSSLPSTAFAVKMLALLSAIVLSLVVSGQSRRQDQRLAVTARLAALVAAAFWLAGLFLFATTRNLGAGSLLVASTGFLLVGALLPHRQRLYLAIAGAILLIGLGGSFFLPATAEGDALVVRFSLVTVTAAAAWALFNVWRQAKTAATWPVSLLQLVAFASILSWLTVAAAGRWIGFS